VTRRRDGMDAAVVRSEDELRTDVEVAEVGAVRARTHVDTEHARHLVDRGIEHAEVERLVVDDDEGDDGQVWHLPDGSISIPVLEEELVVTKRLRVRERIMIRKTTTTEQAIVEADLRRERVELEVDPAVSDRVTAD
jgi:uncharacterized protein (TIGR02271 family)